MDRASLAGNRTPVSRVTGGDTYHYTTKENICKLGKKHQFCKSLCYISIAKQCRRRRDSNPRGETPMD